RQARSRWSSSSSSGGATAREATGTPSASSTQASANRAEPGSDHEGELRLPLHVSAELGGVGYRSPAGEALADVDRGCAVDERLALEERDVVRRAEGDDRGRVETPPGSARDLRVRVADDR